MGEWLRCFKAYDVRGVVPEELNPDIAYRIGRAYADETHANSVCIGYDIRLSGPELCKALTNGLVDAGVNVTHLGLVGTEMVYFATAAYHYDGGVMITASHNPPEYNGMKMVRRESRPISSDTGLTSIEKRAHDRVWVRSGLGNVSARNCYHDFVEHLLKLIPPADLKPLRILANAGNGAAGIALRALSPHLPLEIEAMHFEPDGHFPNGVPNPILEESRKEVVEKLRGAAVPYDFGVAWDGDYDRCFFFDEHGTFIEGYYIVGLLAQSILAKDRNQTIVYDPRLTWNTLEIVSAMGGRAEVCKSGHAFIKEKMRALDAIYGGEMSAHHYFRDHWYCDSGMIPFLLIARLVSQTGRTLGDLVSEMVQNYPCSGEINFRVQDVPTVLKKVEAEFADGIIDHLDGLTVEYPEWRFNLRGSNTEPVLRLNVETRGDADLVWRQVSRIEALVSA